MKIQRPLPNRVIQPREQCLPLHIGLIPIREGHRSLLVLRSSAQRHRPAGGGLADDIANHRTRSQFRSRTVYMRRHRPTRRETSADISLRDRADHPGRCPSRVALVPPTATGFPLLCPPPTPAGPLEGGRVNGLPPGSTMSRPGASASRRASRAAARPSQLPRSQHRLSAGRRIQRPTGDSRPLTQALTRLLRSPTCPDANRVGSQGFCRSQRPCRQQIARAIGGVESRTVDSAA